MKIMNDLERGMEEIANDSLAVLNRGMTSLGYVYTNNRLGSGLIRKKHGECVVNAIVSLTGLPYEKVHRKVAEVNARYSEMLLPKDAKHLKDWRGKRVNSYWLGKKTFRFGTNTGGHFFCKICPFHRIRKNHFRRHIVNTEIAWCAL